MTNQFCIVFKIHDFIDFHFPDSYREMTPETDSDQDMEQMDSDSDLTFELISDHSPKSTFIEDLYRMSTFFPEYSDFKVHNTTKYPVTGRSDILIILVSAI